VDEWGRIIEERGDTDVAWWRGGTVRTPEELERYEPPLPDSPGVAEMMRIATNEIRGDMSVGALSNTGFSQSYEIRGSIREFVKDMYTNPGFVKKLMAKVADAFLEWSEFLIDAGVDVLVLSDDYCDSHGPMISPKLFREFELPYLKRALDLAKSKDVPVLKHTDGNAYPILEEMIDAGIAGLNPIEPGAMDIHDVKQRYGDQIFLMGNVDCRYVLPYGSEEEVRRDVRRCIDAASLGGGYILSSSNTLHANCKPENVLTMIDEARKYGKYRLNGT
jgi:uroporphyrinogen decarboxylase